MDWLRLWVSCVFMMVFGPFIFMGNFNERDDEAAV